MDAPKKVPPEGSWSYFSPSSLRPGWEQQMSKAGGSPGTLISPGNKKGSGEEFYAFSEKTIAT